MCDFKRLILYWRNLFLRFLGLMYFKVFFSVFIWATFKGMNMLPVLSFNGRRFLYIEHSLQLKMWFYHIDTQKHTVIVYLLLIV